MEDKKEFEKRLKEFVATLSGKISDKDKNWTVKGFVDTFKNVYTISADTKIISKILEIHIFPELLKFADKIGYRIVLADHQNYYPDISFVKATDESVRFAVDFKTTYRNQKKPAYCNGFTLGSHGAYFKDRKSTKNIQFPYGSYAGHFCLGIIYDRINAKEIDETKILKIDELNAITSVIGNFQFFSVEKWKIASDKRGSGNTANIGSINKIEDILSGSGMFSNLGEKWFDDYWMNYGIISVTKENGEAKIITSLADFIDFRDGDKTLIRKKAGKKDD